MAESAMEKEMRKDLLALLEDSAGWGVMVYLQYPGDVPFLAPITPELRGLEIVVDRGRFDLWRDGDLVRPGLSKAELVEYVQSRTPQDDATLKANVGQWAEETMQYFGIPRKENA